MLGNKITTVFNPDQETRGGGAWGCKYWREKMLTYVVNVNTYTHEINQTYNSFSHTFLLKMFKFLYKPPKWFVS